jgi:nucleoid-associated protein EbfC
MGGFNLQDMLSQARQQAEKLQEKMQQITIEASSGGGSVTVRMSGQKQLLSIAIEPEVVKSGDIEMLQDLVVAAVNEAARKVDEATEVQPRRDARRHGTAGNVKAAPGLQNQIAASEQSSRSSLSIP